MNKLFRFFCLIVSATVLISSSLPAQNENVMELYQKAKKKCYTHEWEAAVSLFQELLEKYPGSKFEDDAMFWIAYSLEMMPDHKNDAFMAYAKLIDTYPKSNWVDDATLHQIDLAEALIKEGDEDYRTFLYKGLKDDLRDIQFRAAIALGRIGDPQALPVLKNMEKDKDYGTLAQNLSALLQISRMSLNDSAVVKAPQEMDIVYKTDEKDSKEPGTDNFMWFGSARYNQYRSMLKKGSNWSEQELMDFGLWHIVSTDQFEEYRSLKQEQDKKEWLRKFWKRIDPTPTSKENELQGEFIRRVRHAWSKYSALWDYSDFSYMPDQYLSPKAIHAPWDARGELYIKYGEPEAISNHGWKTEVWTYYRYGVDFLVNVHMTNIYGKAIHAGEMSSRRFNLYGQSNALYGSNYSQMLDNLRSVDATVQANFIYKNEMRFEFNYGADPINKLTLSLETAAATQSGNLQYHYQIPAGEFKMIASAAGHNVRYKEVYVVMDAELHDVARGELVRNISKIPDKDFLIKETIILNLPEGKYKFYLRLEDQNDKKLGIFSQEFRVGKI